MTGWWGSDMHLTDGQREGAGALQGGLECSDMS